MCTHVSEPHNHSNFTIAILEKETADTHIVMGHERFLAYLTARPGHFLNFSLSIELAFSSPDSTPEMLGIEPSATQTLGKYFSTVTTTGISS